MKIDEEMLLHEYDGLSSDLRTFWTLRATILGVGITITVFFISSTLGVRFPYRFLLDLALFFLVYVMLKMIGAITGSQYIFTYRMAEISKKLKAPGFWAIWPDYIKKCPGTTGSDTYVVIMRFLNITIGMYVIVGHIVSIIELFNILRIIVSGLFIILVCVFMYIINKIISNEINPLCFHDKLLQGWNQASKDVLDCNK
jgi:hypothetical protein